MRIHNTSPAEDNTPRRFSVDAVLFDLDGTLIDSTPATERAWRRWGEHMGLESFSYGAHGVPAQALVEQVIEADRQAEAFDLIKALEMADTDGVVRKDGAVELLESLPEGAWTIVTSCTQGLAQTRMSAAGIAEPARMVTADHVSHGKPHPEPFLLGASWLGVDISRCLVVEDAPAGLASGRAAGAVTLAVAGTSAATELDADHVVNSLSAVGAEVLPDDRIQITLS